MRDFDYERASSVEDALRRHGATENVAWIAGGLSLVPAMKGQRARPERVIDISRIAALKTLSIDDDHLVLGAGVTHSEVAESPLVQAEMPALAALADGIGHPSVRHCGSLGGTLAVADPVTDWPGAVVALGAVTHTDRRDIAADDFFTGAGQTALMPGELILDVRFPLTHEAAYRKFANPASRYAMAGAFVARLAGEVRVAVTGAGRQVHREPRLERALQSRFEPAAAQSTPLDASRYMTDLHGDGTYRAQLVRTMVARAVEAILTDGGSSPIRDGIG